MSATKMISRYDLFRLVLPRQFFKSVGEPKADRTTMFGFATAVYIAVLVAFILLVIDTSGNYINEVTITSSDRTGSDGYTCEMISKVTNTYTTRSDTDPTTSYYLVNIIESKAQCETNLAIADPCNTPQTYIAGDSTPLTYSAGIYFTAVGMYGHNQTYEVDSYGYFLIYNYGNGSQYYSSTPVVDIDTNFFGIDKSGNINYLQRNGSNNCAAVTCVMQTTPYFKTQRLWDYTTPFKGLINDNLYNLYLYDNTTLYYVDYASAIPTQTVLLQLNSIPILSPNAMFLNVAVYVNATNNVRTIYFGSKNATSGSTSFYMHRDGITIKLVTPMDVVATTPLVTNGHYMYCPCTLENQYSAICAINLIDTNSKGYIDQSFQPIMNRAYQSIAMSSSSNLTDTRIFITASTDNAHTTNQYFFYQDSFQMEELALQSNFAAGWFTCGENVIAPVSQLTSTYTSECSSNGIVGSVLYQEKKTYIFTPTDAATYAISNSAPYCPAIYAQACNTVADLPPYSCTKKVYPTVFTVLGTAFANSRVLLTVLIFACSIALTYMSKYFPAFQGELKRSKTKKEDNAVSEDDVELGTIAPSGTKNPINDSL